MAELGYPMAAAMAQAIALRESLMVDTCRVTRDTGESTEDADGNVIPADPTVVYEGRCTIADPSTAILAGRTSNDQAGVPDQRVLRVPHTAALDDGDRLTVTAAAVSPGLIGEVFVVVGDEDHRSYATYRRYRLRGSSWESATTGGSTAQPGS